MRVVRRRLWWHQGANSGKFRDHHSQNFKPSRTPESPHKCLIQKFPNFEIFIRMKFGGLYPFFGSILSGGPALSTLWISASRSGPVPVLSPSGLEPRTGPVPESFRNQGPRTRTAKKRSKPVVTGSVINTLK